MRGNNGLKLKLKRFRKRRQGGHSTIGLPSLDGWNRSWGLCKEGRMIYLALEDAEGDGAVHLITKQQNKWWQCYAHVGIALPLFERTREPVNTLCTSLAHFRLHEHHSKIILVQS